MCRSMFPGSSTEAHILFQSATILKVLIYHQSQQDGHAVSQHKPRVMMYTGRALRSFADISIACFPQRLAAQVVVVSSGK